MTYTYANESNLSPNDVEKEVEKLIKDLGVINNCRQPKELEKTKNTLVFVLTTESNYHITVVLTFSASEVIAVVTHVEGATLVRLPLHNLNFGLKKIFKNRLK
jgi:hypothetical protein